MTKKIIIGLFLLIGFFGSQISTNRVLADSTADTNTNFKLIKKSTDNLTMATPPSFDFGSLMISSQPVVAQSKGNEDLKITDLRGSGAGWKVQVQMTDFVDSDNPALVLTGAKLELAPIGITANDTNNSTGVPSSNNIDVNDSLQTLIAANTGDGMGAWTADFASNNSAQLTIPANSKKGNYTTTITWVLSDTP